MVRRTRNRAAPPDGDVHEPILTSQAVRAPSNLLDSCPHKTFHPLSRRSKLTFSTLSPITPGGEPVPFDHPFVMAGFMFFGECLCLAWFRTQESCSVERRSSAARAKREGKQLPFYAFAAPAACDLVGTSVMYVGLTLTTASTYQMLRGSVIIFTVRARPHRQRTTTA